MATLNTEEVDALMDAIKEGRVETPAPAAPGRSNVVPYDLTSHDRIIRGQMPTLDAINEQVASMLATGLAGRTRLSLKVTSAPATLMKFADFNSMIAPPTTVAVLSLGHSHGMALVVLEPGLGEALLSAALGDRKVRAGEPPGEARRELTSVERLVLKRLLQILTDAMTRAWVGVLAFAPEVMRIEADPRLAVIAPPNEAAIVSAFDLSGAITGRIQVTIPFAAVEPVKKSLSDPPRVHSGGDARFTQSLCAQLDQVKVELCAQLGRVVVPLSRLVALEVGDVLTLDTEEGQPIPIFVEGRQKFVGMPRAIGGSHAVVLQQGLAAEHLTH